MPKNQDQPDGEQKKAKQKRRAHGEGSVSLRPDGHWQAQMVLETGKRKYFYGKTKKEALDKLHQAQHEQHQGRLATGKSQTLKTYLDHWLEQAHKLSVGPRTYDFEKAFSDHEHRQMQPQLPNRKGMEHVPAD